MESRKIMRASNKANLVFSTIEQILASKQVSRNQHLQLTSLLLSNQHVTEADRLNINQVLEKVEIGQVDLID